MEGLTKLEKILTLSAFASGISNEELEKCVGDDLIEQLDEVIEDMFNNSTPKQMKEAGRSAISKVTRSLLKDNEQQEKRR
ncbi:hypothetical protein AAHB50_31955 [Bacillus toyonensis]